MERKGVTPTAEEEATFKQPILDKYANEKHKADKKTKLESAQQASFWLEKQNEVEKGGERSGCFSRLASFRVLC